MANQRDLSRAPIEISANRQYPPRKETQSPSERCVHHAASSRTYCQPGKKEGLKKTRATTLPAFWAAGSRQSGVFAYSRIHSPRAPHETQRLYNWILPMLTLCRASPIILMHTSGGGRTMHHQENKRQ